MDDLHTSSPFFSNRPFANCIDYLTDYCVAAYIAPVVVSVCRAAHAESNVTLLPAKLTRAVVLDGPPH